MKFLLYYINIEMKEENKMEIQLVYIVEGYKFKEYKNAANFEEFIKNKNFK